jgi:hypothetical protein
MQEKSIQRMEQSAETPKTERRRPPRREREGNGEEKGGINDNDVRTWMWSLPPRTQTDQKRREGPWGETPNT